MLNLAQADPEQCPDLPMEVENYQELAPLEPAPKPSFPDRTGFFLHYVSSAYKAVNSKDGQVHCLRRIHS